LVRGVFVYGDPIFVPSAADRATMELKRRGLEEALEALTARAESLASGGPSR